MGAIPIIKRTAGVEDSVFAGQPVMVVDEWEDVCNANFSRTLQSVAQRLEHTAGTLDPRHWLPWCKQGQYEGAPFGVTFEGSASGRLYYPSPRRNGQPGTLSRKCRLSG